MRFWQNHNCITPYFCGHMCCVMRCSAVWCSAVQCSLELIKIITAPHLIFAGPCAVRYIRYGLKPIYISNCGFFLPSEKLIFPFVLGQVLKYWVNFSLFWVGFPNQHLQELLIFFFLKTRVIKLLINNIFNIKKINILIYREDAMWCNLCGFLIIKLQTRLQWCSAMHCYLRCDAIMLFCGRFWCDFVVWWTLLISPFIIRFQRHLSHWSLLIS